MGMPYVRVDCVEPEGRVDPLVCGHTRSQICDTHWNRLICCRVKYPKLIEVGVTEELGFYCLIIFRNNT